ncbi:MAG: 1-acyl-sn-glycerol-3-phosphate acyltransferase [Actinomycetota bacterium]
MRRRLATWALRRRGWRLAGETPRLPKYLVVFGPHTCNWDFPLAMLAAAGFGIRLRWLGKHSIFRWPVAGFLRRMGGIPVHRERHEGIVEQIAAGYAAADSLVVGIAPEGTRTPTPYWRSGFYHMALAAGVPIVPASLDRPTRCITLGPAMTPSGDAAGDMKAIRAFYAGTRGIHPEKASAIRLQEEEAVAPCADG